MTSPLVLVHGGAHGAWCWEPTRRASSTVESLAVDLPPKASAGRAGARSAAPPELATIDARRLRVVGHRGCRRRRVRPVRARGSLDGWVDDPGGRGGACPERVQHLVFVSCIGPAGRRVDRRRRSRATRAASIAIDRSSRTVRTRLLGTRPATTRRSGRMFCNDMDDEQADFVLAHTGVEARAVFGERVTRVGHPARPPEDVRAPRERPGAVTRGSRTRRSSVCVTRPGGDVRHRRARHRARRDDQPPRGCSPVSRLDAPRRSVRIHARADRHHRGPSALHEAVRGWLDRHCAPAVLARCSTPTPRAARRSGTSSAEQGGSGCTSPRRTAARATACPRRRSCSRSWAARRARARSCRPCSPSRRRLVRRRTSAPRSALLPALAARRARRRGRLRPRYGCAPTPRPTA